VPVRRSGGSAAVEENSITPDNRVARKTLAPQQVFFSPFVANFTL